MFFVLKAEPMTPDQHTRAMLAAYHQARQRRPATVSASLCADGFISSQRPDATTGAPRTPSPANTGSSSPRLGIGTTLHMLWHYSATKRIAAVADIRTVARLLGRAEGGTPSPATPAWLRETDNRASDLLIAHLPTSTTPETSKLIEHEATSWRRPRHQVGPPQKCSPFQLMPGCSRWIGDMLAKVISYLTKRIHVRATTPRMEHLCNLASTS